MLNIFQKSIKCLKAKKRETESGNVLFLILIAVALFAALSYAVTQSSRSGGGDANDETNLISSAEITQYPSGTRTSIIRMIISKGADASELNFDPPSAFATTCTATPANCVFHPSGGGATYNTASPDVMADAAAGIWNFSGHYEVTNIGVSDGTTSFAGNDIIAFLPGIKSSICAKINVELGISGDAISTTDYAVDTAAQQMISGYSTTNAGTGAIAIGTSTGAAGLDSQPFGCITDSASEYIYYHVLVER